MIIEDTFIDGLKILKPEPRRDDRGSFSRVLCMREMMDAGLDLSVRQVNNSENRLAFTLRGMHWQTHPARETKIVRVSKGEIQDVVVDLRPTSPTFLQHFSYVLDDHENEALYIPPGMAHGFLTLANYTDVLYFLSNFYSKDAERGFRYDDQTVGIRWVAQPMVISDRDRQLPGFDFDAMAELT